MGILLDDLLVVPVPADGQHRVDKRQRRLRQVIGGAPSLSWHEMFRFVFLCQANEVIEILLEGGEQAASIDFC
jgi:hypothetical protein